MDRVYGARKRRLFADLPPRVLELGAGAGANLRYYPAGTALIAVEPNPCLHDRLRAAARERGIELELHGAGAERLELPDGSLEAVVCTLVLCTVRDPARVLSEVRRVLQPGGRFLFVEHVAASPGSALRALQTAVRHPWRWLVDGCCVDRDTAATLEAAGFAELDLERFRLRTPLLPIVPHLAGVAVR